MVLEFRQVGIFLIIIDRPSVFVRTEQYSQIKRRSLECIGLPYIRYQYQHVFRDSVDNLFRGRLWGKSRYGGGKIFTNDPTTGSYHTMNRVVTGMYKHVQELGRCYQVPYLCACPLYQYLVPGTSHQASYLGTRCTR